MLQLELLVPFLLFILSLFMFLNRSNYAGTNPSSPSYVKFPRSYPLIGSSLAIFANRRQLHQWLANILHLTPTGTFVLHRSLGVRHIITANPLNVQHILKTRFSHYPKGRSNNSTLHDFLGSGIINVDGDMWKFQRQLSIREFNTKALRKFVETVVETELSNCLIPLLSAAAAKNSILDLQDILQRFTFDNICEIAFGFNPECLSPSLPPTEFSVAFEEATRISCERFISVHPSIWKAKRALNIGSEKHLRRVISKVRGFAEDIVKRRKQELKEKSLVETADLLSRIIDSTHSDEDLMTDMVISFILGGRDTTSAALTWFFWLISQNSNAEEELLKEIREMRGESIFHEAKDLVYTHASLCESMRLYPPVPVDTKEAACDDVLPDGTVVKKGMRVTYHAFAMGRAEKLWGPDWSEFKPERWLERDRDSGKWSFIGRDVYMYPVFQAGPRICLGKDMAFLQMKRVVAEILRRLRVVPVIEKGVEPVYLSQLTSKMEGGLPVKIEMRKDGAMSVDQQ